MKNTQNNVKKNKRFAAMMAAAVITLSGAAAMLTGCGTDVGSSISSPVPGTSAAVEGTAATTTATTANTDSKSANTTAAKKSAHTQAAEAASPVSAPAADTNTTTVTSNTNNDGIGVDRETAISNVRARVGSGAEIVSCEKGKAPDTDINCWVVVVKPVTNGNGPEQVTYYSGYQFCYPLESNAASTASTNGGQNPMMNFIGTYTNGRAMMTVSCSGKNEASIQIKWSGSAFEGSVWTMSGAVSASDEGVTVTYNNCTKQSHSYSEDGVLLSNTTEYDNGSGSVFFSASDYNAYWNDAAEGAGAGSSFWFCNE